MTALVVGVVKETAPGERRVSLVPEAVGRLAPLGVHVLVEPGAGAAAWFPDEAYVAAGAEIATADELYRRADVLVCVTPPDVAALRRTHREQTLVGLLRPFENPDSVGWWAHHAITAISLDLLPRTLPRAQAMDALTSQANLAGYKAAIVAADAYGGYFPMLVTASGTFRPAEVLVLGAGVAGLQAVGTARRLGAIVTGYDVRPAARADIVSLGAKFLELSSVASGAGEGGYARELTAAEREAQQAEIAGRIAGFDVVITTAQVPGRTPPELVSAEALHGMRPGSVVVDMAAGPSGGNVAGSRPDATVVAGSGVTVIGAGNLPARMPSAASTAYSRNVTALLTHLVADGELVLDLGDEITGAVTVTRGGAVVNRRPAGAAAVGGVS